MFKQIYIVFISSCFLVNVVSAQTDTATLENETIDIIKDYEPVVKRANKKNFAPKIPEIVIDKPNNQNYNLPISYQEVEYEPSELRPLGYPKEDDVSLPFMYLKAGFGNYLTPLLDFQVTNKNTENFRVGLGLQHVSSRRKKIENQKFGETEIKLLGEYYLNGMTIGAQPYFNINTYHFYGYDQEVNSFTADETRNRYNKGGVKFFLFNHEENRIGLDYNTAVTFHSTTDDYDNKEINFNWDIGVSKTFREIFKVGGNVMMNVNSFKGIANENRFALGINPYLEVGKDRWFVRGGFWFLTDEGTVYALPDIKHQSKLYKDYIVMYNEWIGNLEINNLNTLSETNPWLAQSIKYNNYRVEARNFIGFKGNVPIGIDYDVRFSQMVYYDVPLFVNDTSTVFNKFMVQYDNKLKAWNPHISLGYQLGEFLKIRTSFDYFSYSTSDLINEAPWHLPAFKADASAIFQYNNKFIFKADVIGFSGVKVKNDEGNVEKLKGNVDLNFSANYLLNKNISFFAEVNNALSLKSERWYKYPGYGFLALGGVIVSF